MRGGKRRLENIRQALLTYKIDIKNRGDYSLIRYSHHVRSRRSQVAIADTPDTYFHTCEAISIDVLMAAARCKKIEDGAQLLLQVYVDNSHYRRCGATRRAYSIIHPSLLLTATDAISRKFGAANIPGVVCFSFHPIIAEFLIPD